ncbi:RraA family protein [Cryobacterium sp. Y62]|uniref:RraA family protein n=1 Tax=Cryobacterium sp. Y62 TaxID=2048284 RepID=UPI001304D447|nr:RraA family protein [Cryobacterium sp. Y62]
MSDGKVSTELGHASVIKPRAGLPGLSLPSDIREALREVALADLSDAVGRLYTLDVGIRPLHVSMPRLIGTAVTVKAYPGDNWTIHGGLSRCAEGDVLVVDWRGYDQGAGTGVSAMIAALSRGLSGVVIDGGWRDIDDIAALGVPVLGRSNAAYSPGKRTVGEINVPVACGGVVVEPGDVIVGDFDGVVCIPRRALDDVLASVRPAALRSCLADYNDDPAGDAVKAIADRYWEMFHTIGGIDEVGR